MKRFILYFLLLVTIVSCNVDDDASNFELETLPVKEADVPSSFEFGNLEYVTIKYDLPNGCHSFYNLFYQYEGTSRIVAVNSLVNDREACTEALIEQEYTFQVNVSQREDYTFRFWKGQDENGENIFEDIVVPVIGNKK